MFNLGEKLQLVLEDVDLESFLRYFYDILFNFQKVFLVFVWWWYFRRFGART